MIALTFVLLICAMTVSVSAAEPEKTPSVSIDKFNLVFDDNVYLKYAVKFDGVEDEDITSNSIGMLYFDEPKSYYNEANATHTSSVVGYTTIDGVMYYTFEYRHISAKQMTDYVYSVAYIDVDGQRYYSAPVKYSVLDYCYAKLGKTGVESDNEAYKELLSVTLLQGAAAQKYFNYNIDRLANVDYYLVEVIGGVLEDGFTKGLYNANEIATLTAPEAESGFEFIGWKNSIGEIVSTDNPATLTGFIVNDTYTATYEEVVKYSEGLAFKSNGNGTCYVSGIGTCTDTDLLIPPVSPVGDKVVAIGDDAFYNVSNIISVVIPDGVTSIGYNAFCFCTELKNVTIPDSVTSIDNYAFGYCYGLTSFVIPDTVTYIGYGIFYASDNIESITLPFLDSSISAMMGYSEYEYDYTTDSYGEYVSKKLHTVIITGGVEILYDAFDGCKYLKNITISNSVQMLPYAVFEDCVYLETLSVPFLGAYPYDYDNFEPHPGFDEYCNTLGIMFGYETNGDEMMPECTAVKAPPATLATLEITGTTAIKSGAFINCQNITKIILSENITTIEYHTFNSSDNNKNLVIYCALHSTPEEWPSGWNNRYKVVWAYGHTISDWIVRTEATCLQNGEKYQECTTCKVISATESIPMLSHTESDWIVDVANGCYNDGTKHKECVECKTVLETVTIYSEHNFVDLVCADCGVGYYSDGLNIQLNSAGDGYIVRGKGRYKGTDIIIPDTYNGLPVIEIASYSFQNTSVNSLVIGNNVRTIGEKAFYCSYVKSVTWGENIEYIRNEAFYRCGFQSLYLPDSVKSIGYSSFAFCGLYSVSIGNNIQAIGSDAFSWNFNLSSFSYRGTVEEWTALNVSIWFAEETAFRYIACSNGSVSYTDPGDGAD